jgi:hypothetical protein
MYWRYAGVTARGIGGWTSYPIKRRLASHLVAGSHTLPPRHYRRMKRRLQDLPPCVTAGRFEATFDKVWNGYLFSENRGKINIKKSGNAYANGHDFASTYLLLWTFLVFLDTIYIYICILMYTIICKKYYMKIKTRDDLEGRELSVPRPTYISRSYYS